jgi:hypothetical protein
LTVRSRGLSVDGKAVVDIAGDERLALDVARMPDELLEELVGVLVADNRPGGVDDVTCVLNQLATLAGKLAQVDGRVVEEIGQPGVDLRIRRHTPPTKRFNNAVEVELGSDESKLLNVCGLGLTFRSMSLSFSALSTGAATEPLAGCSLISFFAGGRDMVCV